MSGRLLFTVALVFGVLGSVASPAQAQLCPLSHLSYIVRDASGTAVHAAANSFTFQGSADNVSWRSDSGMNYLNPSGGFVPKMPAELLMALRDKMITPLTVGSRSCVFKNGATLSVTMSGKTMDLTFNIAQRLNDSKSYLVDGLPFQEGHFEISLPLAQGQHHFFPAKDWTAAQQSPTFRGGVEVALLHVQVRANRGHALPKLAVSDFLVRINGRVPALLYAEPVQFSPKELQQFPFSRFRWPKDEEAVIYRIGIDPNSTDCRQVPKVALSPSVGKDVGIRAVQWTPKPGCFPPGTRQ